MVLSPALRAATCALTLLTFFLAGAPANDDVRVIRPNAPVRDRPNRLAESPMTLPEGSLLKLAEPHPQNGYLKVVDPSAGWEGWIHESMARVEMLPREAGAAAPASRAAAFESTEMRESPHLELGRPVLLYDRQREGYCVAVDARTRIPLWVQYVLKRSDLDGPGNRNNSKFEADRSLPRIAQAELNDYRGSGFDRGHMAPAGDMKRSQPVMDDSFYLSNVAPQVGNGFNRHIWKELEEAVRDWVRSRDRLTVITGPAFVPDSDNLVTYRVIGENAVAVPTHYFKIVVDVGTDPPEALAFMLPNRSLYDRHYSDFLCSIDRIEALTGLDFLTALPDDVEERLERFQPHDVWDGGVPLRAASDASEVRIHGFSLDDRGGFTRTDQLEQLVRLLKRENPTHIFVIAHGWNNSPAEALASYERIMDEMTAIANSRAGTRPEPYRPFVIGVVWPSKAWSRECRGFSSPQAGEDLTLALAKVLPSDNSDNYLGDLTRLRELLLEDPAAISDERRRDAWDILCRHSIPAETREDESIFDGPSAGESAPQGGRWSIRDMLRVFTFWQMKKRAGIVGGAGGRQLIERIMHECPDAELHLGGHSFGCKFCLAALAEQELPSKVDSLTLIQGAVSSYAFARSVPGEGRPGGYRAVLDRVAGPIVVTHSEKDNALTWAYPLGARLSNDVGEIRGARGEPSRYSAMGAVGALGVAAKPVVLEKYPNDPAVVPPCYSLGTGLVNVDGNALIDSHSGFYNPHIAWLLWRTVETRE